MKQLERAIILLLISGLFIIPVIADIPIEGMKQYNYQYVINNSDNYKDYVLFTSSEIWNFQHPSIVINGTFGGGYKLDGFVLHAIRDSELDPSVKEQISRAEPDNKDLTGYFTNATIATSDIQLPVSTNVDESIPLSNITVLLQIQDISDNVLNVTKIQTIYGFENGTSTNMSTKEENDDSQYGDVGT